MKVKPSLVWSEKELVSILESHLPKTKLDGTNLSEKLSSAVRQDLFTSPLVGQARICFQKLSPACDLLLFKPKNKKSTEKLLSATEQVGASMRPGEVLLIADPRLVRRDCLMLVVKPEVFLDETGMCFFLPDGDYVHVVQLSRLVNRAKLESAEEEVQWD
jgi:hypothetical protein